MHVFVTKRHFTNLVDTTIASLAPLLSWLKGAPPGTNPSSRQQKNGELGGRMQSESQPNKKAPRWQDQRWKGETHALFFPLLNFDVVSSLKLFTFSSVSALWNVACLVVSIFRSSAFSLDCASLFFLGWWRKKNSSSDWGRLSEQSLATLSK